VVCATNRTCFHGGHSVSGRRGSAAHHIIIISFSGYPYINLPIADATSPVEKFPLGRIVATPGALAVIPPEELQSALRRHHSGDWGELCEQDRHENERSLRDGGRLMSVYHTKAGVKFYIITESERATTTALLPGEY
jgi:hypothetical protein